MGAPTRDFPGQPPAAFNTALAANKTRAIGVSDFNVDYLARLLRLVDATPKLVPPAVNQFRIAIGAADTPGRNLTATRALCRARGILLGGFSSLSKGQCMQLPAVADIAAAHGASAAAVCLRWVTQQGFNVVVSSASADYDREDLASVHLQLTDSEMARLSAL